MTDAKDPKSRHDFGRDILPKLAGKAPMYAYNFETNRIPGEAGDSIPYWRDVGTIDAYYEANMDLNHVKPDLNLYNREWPVRSTSYPDPPAKFVFDENGRRGEARRQHRIGRVHSLGRTGAEIRSGTRRACAHRRIGRRLRDHGQLRHRTTREGAAGDPRQKRSHSGGHAKSASISRPISARGWHVTDSGIVVIGRAAQPGTDGGHVRLRIVLRADWLTG